MYTAIVKKDDYSIATVYVGPTQVYGGPWGDSSQYEHIEFDEVVVGSSQQLCLTAADNVGTTEISLNVQPQRDAKLSTLRVLREPKLSTADRNIQLHDDIDPSIVGTEAAWRTYRKDLRAATDIYKDADPNSGLPALDSFSEDMSDFSGWPTEPF